ncbi:hypothetical protein ONE63_002304 [Megalurothrips usitatus]|uniref:Regulatory protein zeste n=1 Tax=Megalurothrips usitatus TaxID=439358 RepID=A0AAV7XA48_9NEOP|nr:hypothetical protein ONE63_002304 [Megalurothrips usitatus]
MSCGSPPIETQGKKQGYKITQAQREMMLNFMRDHPCLSTGRFTAPDGAKRKQRLLEEMTGQLNACAMGATKSGEKWMKSWQDWRSDVKAKAAKLKRHRGGTGGGAQCPIALNNLEERLLEFIGPVCVSGHATPDPLQECRPDGASEVQNVAFQNYNLNHQPSPVLPVLVDNSHGMAVCATDGAAMECSELTNLVPVAPHVLPPVPQPQPSPAEASTSSSSSATSSARKRRRTMTECSEHSTETESLVNIFSEAKEVMKKRLDIQLGQFELEKERLAIDKRRLEMECEQSRVICENVQNVSSSFCTAMQM